MKSYYRRNRDQILAKQRDANSRKHECPCGADIAAARRFVHEASDKHQRYLRSRQELDALAERMRKEKLIASEALVRAAALLADSVICVYDV